MADFKVILAQDLRQANRDQAAANRARFKTSDVMVVNLISSPGAGKTSILEATLARLAGEMKIGVIEGDIATSRDAARIAGWKVPVVQINTAGACHLDAALIAAALPELPLEELDLLFIENVGNLVCPAEFDLGEDVKVGILSVAEGSDKPLKYPLVFQEAQVLLLNKIDLLPYTDFDLAAFRQDLKALNPNLLVITLSARTGEGLEEWFLWLKQLVASKKKQTSPCGATA
ncbi:Hydrogenase accessory protein HypB [Moorella glycerini]|uniref:Hydrogenase isoenzymes nickel incorporation protein HypB n=1 Tax=Neomoorella stamsii TaxID=1266720 RepID=A0A9X7J621_9FIRM|nr:MULTISPECIES: hydrogenase nickel incorporation protein HypB [Moorella]PRR77590.1 Hydrogenase isoenzymes nickel incorporation protein HypB [Moorella stamsii]CEP69363.1 Hydrogenase accessory protein HypB [Moorella glycerini]